MATRFKFGPRATLACRGVRRWPTERVPFRVQPPLMLLHGLGMTADLNWGPAYAELCELLPCRGARPTGPRSWCAPVARLQPRTMRGSHCGAGRFVGNRQIHRVRLLDGKPDCTAPLAATSRPDRWTRSRCHLPNFLGSPVERLVSSLAPAFAVAALANPLLRTLPADALGIGYLNDVDDESRSYVHAEMRHTSMSTVTAAMAAVADFTSHKWISDVDVPVSVLVTATGHRCPPWSADETRRCDPACHRVIVDGDHGVFVESPTLFAQKVFEACQAVKVRPPRSSRRIFRRRPS